MSPRLLFTSLLIAATLSIGFGLASGALPLSVAEVAHALWHPADGIASEVVWQLRLPRVVAAFICGGLLALAGVLLQTLLRNPLADPYILGVSSGAAVGRTGRHVAGGRVGAYATLLIQRCLAVMLAVFGLGFRHGERNIYRLLLTGVVVSAGCGAVVSLLLTLAQGAQVQGMLFWLMGDLSHAQPV